uniref:Disease resistance protein n=1 Tax=Chenopodium quinoa TaxID=63459 RepID=A0A803MGN4_CHEQI
SSMETLKNLLNISEGKDDKLQTLKRKARALHVKAEDVLNETKQEELQPGKRRRKEVDNWLKDVKEVVLRGKDLITSDRNNAGLIEQIGELTMQGSFPRGFTFYAHGSSSVALKDEMSGNCQGGAAIKGKNLGAI